MIASHPHPVYLGGGGEQDRALEGVEMARDVVGAARAAMPQVQILKPEPCPQPLIHAALGALHRTLKPLAVSMSCALHSVLLRSSQVNNNPHGPDTLGIVCG